MKEIVMKRLTTFLLAAGIVATECAATASAATLTPAAQTALQDALNDEYRAEAFYAAVIAKFGAVRPFSNIIEAERTHSTALRAVMKSYGIETSANPLIKDAKIAASVPATLAEACAIGVKAEIDNRDLYDKKLLPAVAGYPDVITVFRNLRDASQNNHLPAFQNCGGNGGVGRR